MIDATVNLGTDARNVYTRRAYWIQSRTIGIRYKYGEVFINTY